MISLTLKTGQLVQFEMANFEKEISLVNNFPKAKQTAILNLKKLGFYQVSEIESMDHVPLEVLRDKADSKPQQTEIEKMLGHMDEQKSLKAKLFAGYVQRELGYLPIKHPMFEQVLQTVINENAHALKVKMPMYVNLLANSVRADTPKGA